LAEKKKKEKRKKKKAVYGIESGLGKKPGWFLRMRCRLVIRKGVLRGRYFTYSLMSRV
jgi:hypothetical protein